MDVLAHLRLAHGALVANLLVAAALAGTALAAFWCARRLLRNWGGRLTRWMESHPLKAVSKEAVRHAEILLSRLTLTAVVLILAGAAAYHFAGRDVQADVSAWFAGLDAKDVLAAGLRLCGVVLLLTAVWAALRAVCRLRPLVEHAACLWLARLEDKTAVRPVVRAPGTTGVRRRRPGGGLGGRPRAGPSGRRRLGDRPRRPANADPDGRPAVAARRPHPRPEGGRPRRPPSWPRPTAPLLGSGPPAVPVRPTLFRGRRLRLCRVAVRPGAGLHRLRRRLRAARGHLHRDLLRLSGGHRTGPGAAARGVRPLRREAGRRPEGSDAGASAALRLSVRALFRGGRGGAQGFWVWTRGRSWRGPACSDWRWAWAPRAS